jgi:hypothetical protein
MLVLHLGRSKETESTSIGGCQCVNTDSDRPLPRRLAPHTTAQEIILKKTAQEISHAFALH